MAYANDFFFQIFFSSPNYGVKFNFQVLTGVGFCIKIYLIDILELTKYLFLGLGGLIFFIYHQFSCQKEKSMKF